MIFIIFLIFVLSLPVPPSSPIDNIDRIAHPIERIHSLPQTQCNRRGLVVWLDRSEKSDTPRHIQIKNYKQFPIVPWSTRDRRV